MSAFYQKQGDTITLEETKLRLKTLKFNLLLAKQKIPQYLERISEVGFSTSYHKKRYLIALFNSTKIPNSSYQTDLSAKQLKERLGQYPANGQLNQSQRERYNIPLLENYTLADSYHDASVQARFKLHQGNTQQLNALVNVEKQYQALKNAHKNTKIRWQILEDLALSQSITPALLNYLGVQASMHNESPYLETFKQQVSNDEIKRYYNKHKNDFKYSASVNAAFIVFDNKEQADQALSNSKELKRMLAAHKQQINRDMLANNFKYQVAFNLSDKQGATILRTPNGHWLIVQVFDKKYAFYPKNSETVRYQAITEIAKTKAKNSYEQAKINWFKTGVL